MTSPRTFPTIKGISSLHSSYSTQGAIPPILRPGSMIGILCACGNAKVPDACVDIDISMGHGASLITDIKLKDISDMSIRLRGEDPYFSPSKISGRLGYPITPNPCRERASSEMYCVGRFLYSLIFTPSRILNFLVPYPLLLITLFPPIAK